MKKIVKVPNKISDQELVKMIKEYEEKGYKVKVKSDNISKGYTELILN